MRELVRKFSEAGFEAVEVKPGYNGVEGREPADVDVHRTSRGAVR